MPEMKKPRQAAAVQDLSGFGRCSITVALPILSAMGVQLSCLPTAVLSTHTGGFTGYTFRDLTCDMEPFFRHWQKEGFQFDALYTGYLGSTKQIAYVSDIFEATAAEDCVKVVDPAMADNGNLYPGFDAAFVEAMKGLCAKADYIVPNITESCFLTGMEYKAGVDSGVCVLAKRAGTVEYVSADKITVRHASEVITMEDKYSTAFRQKKDSSMTVSLNLLNSGEGDVVISAGSTGALLTGATLIVKRVKGIRRAAMGPVMPNKAGGKTVILDSAAPLWAPPCPRKTAASPC